MIAPLVDIDLVILTRDHQPLRAEVQQGIDSQPGVRLHVHRVIGEPRAADACRWETIARARNDGRRRGVTQWLMFLDDDVVLEPGSIRRLQEALERSPRHGAMAMDYQVTHGGGNHHVAMGATLFRRQVLSLIHFRWETGRCECQCCCDDLRTHGWGIGYAPGLLARHLRQSATPPRADQTHDRKGKPSERSYVLAAFDRRHVEKFRRQFLGSLRRSGNDDEVIVVGYGLYPTEQQTLSQLPGVRVIGLANSWTMPPVRRLHDFQKVLEQLPPDAPAAYWDAADVFIQDRLEPLWQLVRQYPHKLLAVREPKGYPHNVAIPAWCNSIRDHAWRERAFQLLQRNPFLNSGFAAGTAGTLLAYFREAHRMRHSRELVGTTDWGDQMALNLYCHLDPVRWQEIPEGWNYCAHDRQPGEVWVRNDGRVMSRSGTPIHSVHGNGHSLRKLELYAM